MTSQPAGTPAQRILATSLELLEKGDARGWVDLFAPDGVLEFPYSLPGWPSRFVGHDELWQQMERFPEFLEVRFTEPTFYETGDENFTIAEFSGQGRNIQNGLPFDQDYISPATGSCATATSGTRSGTPTRWAAWKPPRRSSPADGPG